MNNSRAWLMALVMGIILPGLLFWVGEKVLFREQPTQIPAETTTATLPTEPPVAAEMTDGITVLTEDGLTNMEMHTYLTGVLLAEMPAEFSAEALKAQAVVARTYALRHSQTGKHDEGAICTDSTCCQGYRTVAEFLANGGTEALYEKVKSAVIATEAQVLIYDGKLIEATYFSCSGGRTEDALAVWGTDVPYLKAVDSPGEESSLHFTDSTQLSLTEFAEKLALSSEELTALSIGEITYTGGGGVATMVIGNETFTGTGLRQKLGLKSTIFSVLIIGERVHISTRGYGHRVGMSQYGAEAMAVRGSDYREILAYYYPGTALSAYS